MRRTGLFVFICVILAACNPTPGLYEQTQPFKNLTWPATYTLRFEFHIADTTADYNMYFVFRHQQAFEYNNIRISLAKYAANDSVPWMNYNFKLGSADQWEGKKMDQVVEHRIQINSEPVKFTSAPYHILLSHNMQQAQLDKVLAAGIRIEKQLKYEPPKTH